MTRAGSKRFAQRIVASCSLAAAAVCVSSSVYAGLARQAGNPSRAEATWRDCSANTVLEPGKKSKAFRKSRHPAPPEPLPACTEVKGRAIEIQEFLQAAVRDWQWRIGESHASEDSWTFVRYLNDDDLAKYADAMALMEPVVFTGGKAAVTIHTAPIGDGYVRLQISALVLGEGKSTDSGSAPLIDRWPLKSKGVLEQEFIGAVQSRYKHPE